MIHLNFFLYILSFATALVSITVSTLIYLHYKKKVIIYYTLLLVVVTLLLIFRMVHCYLEIFNFKNSDVLLFIALIFKKTAFLLGLFCGPFFTYKLIGMVYTKKRKIVISVLGIIYLLVTTIELIVYPNEISRTLRLYIGIPILFGVFGWHLFLAAFYLGKLGDRILNTSLKIFFTLSIIIFPFSLYQHLTQTPYLPNYIEVPVSFIFLNLLTIIFSFKYFNHPAYFEGNQISGYFLKRFNITEREKEIIALAIQGLSNNDMSEKLFISARTVESHLYKIFQKCDIKNRTQLINLLMSNKK